jgi:hypothetical protein
MMENPLNESKINVPYMRDMAQTTNKLLQQGFDKNFKATDGGLLCIETEKVFKPKDILVVNFYRFEGISDPSDNSILYAIESSDGTKGTLVDAYGAYSDPEVEKFMKQVKIEERV